MSNVLIKKITKLINCGLLPPILWLQIIACAASLVVPQTADCASKDWGKTFAGPFGIAVRKDGSFLVAEIQGKRIAKFDKNGDFNGYITYIKNFGPLKGPFDVDIGKITQNIYIADSKNNQILVLDEQENLILTLGTPEPTAKPGGFHEPHAIAINEKLDRLFVADTHNHRVQIFDTKGKLIRIIGKPGIANEPNTFNFSVGLDCDSQGNLYVMSLYNGNINVYNSDGTFNRQMGRQGYHPEQFHAAYGLTYHNNTIWVADTRNSRIQNLSSHGKAIDIIDNSEGVATNQFNNPTDIDFDAQGNIYIADWKNNRVLKLDPQRKFLRQWPSSIALNNKKYYLPPLIHYRSPSRGPRELAIYGGIEKKDIDNAAKANIDWIYVSIGYDDQKGIINMPGKDWDIKNQIDYAHKKGIKVSAYVGIYYMGAHLPIWKAKPHLYMHKKGDPKPDFQALSYFFPEVRQWKAKHIAEQVAKYDLDGLMLDYIRYPNNLCGYEPKMTEAFKLESGKDPDQIPPDDIDWLNFRAKYITMFITELKAELDRLEKPVIVSAYVDPDWREDLRTVVRNWKDWVNAGLIDMICLGQYSRDFESFYTSVRQAKQNIPKNIRVSIVLACWGGNLNSPELLKHGIEVAAGADPDEIAIYRGDAIYLLDLWDAITDISRQFKKTDNTPNTTN
jgi:DNA-binding beta-propeller fold protein YncE